MTISIYNETRPWGKFTRFTHNEVSTVKILSIKAGEAFSLQLHHKRDEFWRILSGSALVTLDDETVDAHPGNEFSVSKGTKHRIEGITDVDVLEISHGEFDEDDIERLEDKYNRA